MMHSYVALIDESGCHGEKYGEGSTDFLVMSAAIIPAWWEDGVDALFSHARLILKTDKRFKKFSSLSQPMKWVLTDLFHQYPVRTCHVALHKPSLTGSHIRQHARSEYVYLIKLTLERISWYVRDNLHPYDPGNGRCRLVFSHNDVLRRDVLEAYLARLTAGAGIYNCSVEWPFIDKDFEIQRHKNETPIHLADIAASALGDALKIRFGIPDDRYIRNLGDSIYRRNGQLYGLKIFPKKALGQLAETRALDFVSALSRNRPSSASNA